MTGEEEMRALILGAGFAAAFIVPAAAQDWNGFYAGVYGVSQSSESDDQFGLGINAGINAQFDFYLLGAEVAVQVHHYQYY